MLLTDSHWEEPYKSKTPLLHLTAAMLSEKHHNALSYNSALAEEAWWYIFENNKMLSVRRNLARSAETEKQIDAIIKNEKRVTVLDVVAGYNILTEKQIKALAKKLPSNAAFMLLRNCQVEHANVLEFAQKTKLQERLLYWGVCETKKKQEEAIVAELAEANLSTLTRTGVHNFAIFCGLKPHVSRELLLEPKTILNITQSKKNILLLETLVANTELDWEKDGTKVLNYIVSPPLLKAFLVGLSANIRVSEEKIEKFIEANNLQSKMPSKAKFILKKRGNLKLCETLTHKEKQELYNICTLPTLNPSVKTGLAVSMLKEAELTETLEEELKTFLARYTPITSMNVQTSEETRNWYTHYTEKLPALRVETNEPRTPVKEFRIRSQANWEDLEKALDLLPETKEAYMAFLRMYESEHLSLEQIAESIVEIG